MTEIPSHVFGIPTPAAIATLGAAAFVGWMIFFRNSGGGANAQTTGPSAQGLAVMANPDYSASISEQNAQIASLKALSDNAQSQLNTIQNTDASTYAAVEAGAPYWAQLGATINSISGQTSQLVAAQA